MTSAILVLNAGSSSIKFAVYEARALDVLCRGSIDGIGAAVSFRITGPHIDESAAPSTLGDDSTHATLTPWLIDELKSRLPGLDLVAAGHRVVHGGMKYDAPVLATKEVLADLEKLVVLAPGHEPHNLAAIRAATAAWPSLPQVACFDTEFHRNQPRLAQIYALPRRWTDEGILSFGFHGLSYEYIASVLPGYAGARADGRVVAAHLGNGASMCAMLARRGIASSMGFTALDGLMMGTRSGNIDPGVVLYLMQQCGMTAAEVSDLLYNRSGLLGVSGISSDVRELEASDDPRAREALDLFAYRASRELGALVADLSGLDVLVFTAGIGEHSAGVRRAICERSAWAGIAIDHEANNAHRTDISAAGSKVQVLVIPTDEEIVIAQAARRFVTA